MYRSKYREINMDENTVSTPWYSQRWLWYSAAGLLLVGIYLYEGYMKKTSSLNANLAAGGYTPSELAQEINYMTTTLNGMQQTLQTMNGNGASVTSAANAANNPSVNAAAYPYPTGSPIY
jgi:hypothetical protein